MESKSFVLVYSCINHCDPMATVDTTSYVYDLGELLKTMHRKVCFAVEFKLFLSFVALYFVFVSGI